MSDPPDELPAALAALRTELAAVKVELRELRSLVTFLGEGPQRHAVLRASALLLHPPGQPQHIGVQIEARPGGGILFLYPGTSDALATLKLITSLEGSGIIVHSPQQQSNFSLTVQDAFARACVFTGAEPGDQAEASLTASPDGSGLVLRRSDGTPGVEAQVFQNFSTVRLVNTDGEPTAELCLTDDTLSTFSLTDPAGLAAIAAKVIEGSATFLVHRPGYPANRATTLADASGVRFFLTQDERALVLLRHGDEGGSLYVGGPTAESGQVHLQGGTVTGSLALATADGTALLTLDSSHHGGRLAINNDLGFQRILLTTIQESSMLVLNHTGQRGVMVGAGPDGGAITVHDSEGQVRATLPEGDE